MSGGRAGGRARRTTMAMATHWATPESSSRPHTTFQPVARRWTPPRMMTTKETSVHSSSTTAKDMKKPTVRHMLQKAHLSPTQSCARGTRTHVPVTVEQRRERPYE